MHKRTENLKLFFANGKSGRRYCIIECQDYNVFHREGEREWASLGAHYFVTSEGFEVRELGDGAFKVMPTDGTSDNVKVYL